MLQPTWLDRESPLSNDAQKAAGISGMEGGETKRDVRGHL